MVQTVALSANDLRHFFGLSAAFRVKQPATTLSVRGQLSAAAGIRRWDPTGSTQPEATFEVQPLV